MITSVLQEIPELTKDELKTFKKIANEDGGVAKLMRAGFSRNLIDGIRFKRTKNPTPMTRLRVREYVAPHLAAIEAQKEKKKAAA